MIEVAKSRQGLDFSGVIQCLSKHKWHCFDDTDALSEEGALLIFVKDSVNLHVQENSTLRKRDILSNALNLFIEYTESRGMDEEIENVPEDGHLAHLVR
jgi:hypothetical protein